MAIKKTVHAKFGIEVKDAYHRVENLSLTSKEKMTFQVRSRVTAENAIFDEALYECVYDINGANPIAQAYAHLKTLPEFSAAVDC